MHYRSTLGETFALHGCKAWTWGENKRTMISGLYTVEDVVYPDRTVPQAEGGFVVFPVDDPDVPMFFVDDWTWLEQTDPKTAGRMLYQERCHEHDVERLSPEYEDLFS